MKMKRLIPALIISIFLVGILFSSPAFAGRVANLQIRQHHQISQGVKTGELTKCETRRLAREQKAIQGLKKQSLQDGALTPKEKFRLENAQDRSSDHIYFLKHNNREN
jgi:hypothetical protein